MAGKNDIVATIEITLKNGEKHEIPLARRDDPVRGLDKLFKTSTIARTDVLTLRCRVNDSAAITSRACEAVSALLTSFLKDSEDGSK